jgi:cysteinyl-tRNA synthetase
LYDFIRAVPAPGEVSAEYGQKFIDAISEDLNLPKALALAWELISDDTVSPPEKVATLLKFDNVLGLGLDNPPQVVIPAEVQQLADQREKARLAKNFAKSDELRQQISDLGYEVEDTAGGQKLKQK